MKVYDGSAWLNAYASLSGALIATSNLSDLNNAGTARTNLGLGSAATTDASAYATAAQADQTVSLTGAGATSISGTYPSFTITSTDTDTTYSVGDGGLTQNNFTDALKTKLDGVATNANNYTLPFTDNSANWNTAFGWGNHASAGYLTSHQDISGKLNLSGGSLTGNLSTNSKIVLSSAHTKQKIEVYGGGHEWIGTSGATLELSGANINLNGGQGTGTPNLKMGGTTVIDSSRNLTVPTIYLNDTNTRIHEGSGNAVRIQTNSGYGDIGAQNASWFHFYTDRPNFYFHESVHFDGQIYNYSSGNTTQPYYHKGMTSSETIQVTNLDITANHGRGLRFWNGSDSYRIYMSSTGSSGAGRVSGEGSSDYNMYFRMTGGSNRGFVFQNSGNNKAGIDASGNARFTGNVTAYASDARLKENIKPIENPLEKLSKIRGVTYDWKDNIENFDPKCKTETGVIAQEIEAVIPDAISPAPFNAEYKTVEKDKIIALLIEAVKELKAEVDELKAAK
tara:strand:+ start:36842 stop:38365 length:1524 start_codon:yes stop_codon:yes gene_type:complete